MKTAKFLVFLFVILAACSDDNIDCDQGEGSFFDVENQEAQVFFDSRFDTFVIRYHVAGTIDSFRTFLMCNLPEDFQLEKDVIETFIISGQAQPLKERYEPNTVIAGEDFFIIFLEEVKPVGVD